jgi:hypothetical protein
MAYLPDPEIARVSRPPRPILEPFREAAADLAAAAVSLGSPSGRRRTAGEAW